MPISQIYADQIAIQQLGTKKEDMVIEGGGGVTTHNSAVNTTQLQQLKSIFDRFDMDGDGSLTHLELAALLRSLGLKPSGDRVHALLSSIDANGNGSVEFDELAAAIMPDMGRSEVLASQEQLLSVFRAFDQDGNGFITAAELARAMAKMGQPLTFRGLADMFREANVDGDGVISFAESTSVMARSAADFLGINIS